MLNALIILATSFSVLACAGFHGARNEDGSLISDESDPKNSDPILSDKNLPVRDVLEEGFCYDDIYGEFLRSKYYAERAKSKPQVKPWRKSRAKQSAEENESLFYARSNLLGPLPPYFGALPVTSNHEVEFWTRYFKTRGRDTFMKWLVRAESYRELVQPILKAEGLPKELVYLAMVESGFSNTAHSIKRATGTWQFMKGTAVLYDLKINHWVDERRDPVKSTLAAARYLRHLYQQFGDWYLAMAAYNAGPGKIKSAIRKAKNSDFWEISKTSFIRNETKHYVPKVLAALNLASNPRQNGFDLKQDLTDVSPTSTLMLDKPIQMSELSQKIAVPLQLIKKWNLEIIQDITPPSKSAPYPLRLPEKAIQIYEEIKDQLSLIEVTDVLMHKIRPGETLSQIARRYNIKIAQIHAINPQLNAKSLRIGKEIAIPIPGIVTKKSKDGSA